jgi:hypothetical protein
MMASYPLAFAENSIPGSAGARNGDVVVLEYWGQSGFANMAQYQLIRQPMPIADWQFEIEFLDAGVEAFVFTFG